MASFSDCSRVRSEDLKGLNRAVSNLNPAAQVGVYKVQFCRVFCTDIVAMQSKTTPSLLALAVVLLLIALFFTEEVDGQNCNSRG